MTLIHEIEDLLRKKLRPQYLLLEDESFMHKAPSGKLTHLRIVVVSDVFEEHSLVEQHQIVYKILANYLRSGLKALGLTTKTAKVWKSEKDSNKSPACRSRQT